MESLGDSLQVSAGVVGGGWGVMSFTFLDMVHTGLSFQRNYLDLLIQGFGSSSRILVPGGQAEGPLQTVGPGYPKGSLSCLSHSLWGERTTGAVRLSPGQGGKGIQLVLGTAWVTLVREGRTVGQLSATAES